MERINTLINDSAANASSVIKQIPQVAETMHTKVTSLTGFLSGKESPTGGDGQNGNVNDEGENRSSSFGVLIAGTVICVAATVPAVMLWHKTYEGKAARKKEEAKSLANQKERHTLSILGSKLAAVVQDSITSLFVTPSPLSSLSSLQALSWKPLTSLFNQSSYRSNSDGRTITIQGRRNVCEQEAKERVDELIQGLGLIRHPEGGYFKEIYRSGAEPMASKGATDETGSLMVTDRYPPERNIMTSIYWMVTRNVPCAYWCMNKSDHVHYYHEGQSVTYHIIHPDGQYERQVLGPNVAEGEVLQFVVEGGCWKSVQLNEGGFYCLVGEAVAPGFDFVDFTWLKDEQELQAALAPSQAFFNTHAAYRDIDGKHNDGDCDAAATADASAGDGESCDLSASTTGFQYVSRQGDSKDKAFVLTGEQRRKEERRRKQKAMLVGELRHLLKSCKDRNFSVWYK